MIRRPRGTRQPPNLPMGSNATSAALLRGAPAGGDEPAAELAHALERDFGSVSAWRAEFTGMAKALAGGSGWAILAWSERLGRLVNQWAADHAHALAGATPILA